jgi:flagellar hook protein FlgE
LRKPGLWNDRSSLFQKKGGYIYMQRSLFTAISGLNNHQTKLDVIGNNIANVNTTAFKSGRVRFEDILNQTLRGASAPQNNMGGTNPIQVGLGMQVAAIDNNHTQGNLQSTGRDTDIAIQGNGFFVISNGVQNFYTRDGSFSRGSDGYLVNSANGFRVMGWQADNSGIINDNGEPTAIEIPIGFKAVTQATTNAMFAANLGAHTLVGETHVLETNIYDSLGQVHTLETVFEKTGLNQWSWTAEVINPDGTRTGTGTGTITFNTQGHVDEVSASTFTFSPAGADPVQIEMEFMSMSQLVGETTALVRYQNGFPEGVLTSFNIGGTGIITGVYSNGMVRPLGQIALCRFENPEGLSKIGSNMYQSSANSGSALIGLPGTQGRGILQTSTLEMSNVNLAFEFTELITTSRAFQANSRVITSSDELLQEIVNLKR